MSQNLITELSSRKIVFAALSFEVGVLVYLGVAECHVPFLGHMTLTLASEFSSRKIESGAYLFHY